MKKKFTIILPVHNGGEYIHSCIESIMNQRYKDFDLAILENCSTDGTAEWLKKINDERIMIFPCQNCLTTPETVLNETAYSVSMEKNCN